MSQTTSIKLKVPVLFVFLLLMMVVAVAPWIMYNNMEHICTDAIINVMTQ